MANGPGKDKQPECRNRRSREARRTLMMDDDVQEQAGVEDARASEVSREADDATQSQSEVDATSTGFGALSAAEHALSLGPFALVDPDTRHAPRSLAERSSELRRCGACLTTRFNAPLFKFDLNLPKAKESLIKKGNKYCTSTPSDGLHR